MTASMETVQVEHVLRDGEDSHAVKVYFNLSTH